MLPLLDRAVDAVRAQAVPAPEADAARRRVWQRLQEAQSAADAGAQPVPAAANTVADSGRPDHRLWRRAGAAGAYRAGTLTAARQLLVQMHLRDCVGCREANVEPDRGTPDPLA